jgi:hypothetical protein
LTTADSSFKCEECDTSFTSQQGLEQHEKYAVYRRKVAADNNICRRICVCTAQQGKNSKNSYHLVVL